MSMNYKTILRPADALGTDQLKSYPITDLLNAERRKELVPKLAFAKGVTTVVTPSGGGKTTLCFCMGLYVSAGVWGQEEVEQRPLLWILGEDQDGLRAIFEAWTKQNPDLTPDARFIDQMVDFANPGQVKWLIKHIYDYFERPPLIVADALSDILAISGLDEYKSKDVAKVYKGIWQVVNETSALVTVLHHSGWDEKRERGSSTIRQKSDIVVKIVSFDPRAGTIKLEHLKRRSGAGPKLNEFYLEAKLVTLDDYPAPIPVVTGPKPEDETSWEGDHGADERNARKLVEIIVQHFPNGGTFTELHQHFDMSKTSFWNALKCAEAKGWVAGGGGRGQRYNLQPGNGSETSVQGSVHRFTPYRGVKPIEPRNLGSNEPKKNRLRTDEPNASCEKVDTTSPDKKLNEINEGGSSIEGAEISVIPSDDDLIRVGIEATKKPAKAR